MVETKTQLLLGGGGNVRTRGDGIPPRGTVLLIYYGKEAAFNVCDGMWKMKRHFWIPALFSQEVFGWELGKPFCHQVMGDVMMGRFESVGCDGWFLVHEGKLF